MSRSLPTTHAMFSRNAGNQYAPPSLSHLSIWAYLALAFVIFSVTGVLIYAMYSCIHSARNNDVIIGARHRTDETLYRHSSQTCVSPRCGSPQTALPKHSMSSPLLDKSPFYFSPITKPSPIHAGRRTPAYPSAVLRPFGPPASMKSTPVFDSNNIRFVSLHGPALSESTADMCTNPKLYPVQGPIIAIS